MNRSGGRHWGHPPPHHRARQTHHPPPPQPPPSSQRSTYENDRGGTFFDEDNPNLIIGPSTRTRQRIKHLGLDDWLVSPEDVGRKDEFAHRLAQPFITSEAENDLAIETEASDVLTRLLRAYTSGACKAKDVVALFSELNFQCDNSGTSLGSADADGVSACSAEEGSGAKYRSHDTIVDVIWLLDVECEGSQAANEVRERLASLVALLAAKHTIVPGMLMEKLDASLLERAGLVQDGALYERKVVRTKTALFYKQQKWNLFREESEGWSKLIVESMLDMGPANVGEQSDVRHSPPSPDEETLREEDRRVAHAASRAFERITALIGYFELDPNRVLDVILDTFSGNVREHHRFFLELLSQSPWRPEGARESTLQRPRAANEKAQTSDSQPATRKGNHVMTQLLGHKFQYYADTDTPFGPSDDPLQELYTVAALLLRHHFVSLDELWPHLYPQDEQMTAIEKQYKERLSDARDRASGGALAMAAPLLDEEPSEDAKMEDVAVHTTQPTKPARVPSNQKVELLKALLAIGDVEHALQILNNFQYLPKALPEIADLLCRLLHVMIRKCYNAVQQSAFENLASLRVSRPATSALPKSRPKGQATTRLILSEEPESARDSSSDYRFFDSDWTQGIEQVDGFTTFSSPLGSLMRMIGFQLSRDGLLMSKICRIGAHALTHSTSPEKQNLWKEVIRLHLLPALSLSEPNPGIVSEVWALLNRFKYEERYAIYAEWKDKTYQSIPELRIKKIEMEKETRGILRRISSDNFRQFGRQLAKISHSNPCLFFNIALNQVQAYSNLVQPVVDSARYLTCFGYDVLSFTLLDALAAPEKTRSKHDGMNVSMWLQALASFAGTIYRKYAAMDSEPLLTYLAQRMCGNNSEDLILLRELLSTMGGVDATANLSDGQIQALAGGPTLRYEAISGMIPIENRPAVKKSASRLVRILRESGLLLPILILLAKVRQSCIYSLLDAEAHIKLLGNVFDNVQETLFQYFEYLVSHTDTEEYALALPSIEALVNDFQIEPAMAFHISRPRLLHEMRTALARISEISAPNKIDESLKIEVLDDAPAAEPVVQKSEEDSDMQPIADSTESQVNEPRYPDEGNSSTPAVHDALPQAQNQEPDRKPVLRPQWHPGLKSTITVVSSLLSSPNWEFLSPEFYTTFWQLALYDIHVPTERYQQEINKCSTSLRDLENERVLPKSAAEVIRQREKERIIRINTALDDELKEQTSHIKFIQRRLRVEKDFWFEARGTSLGTWRTGLAVAILQRCLQPRLLLSPNEACFCAKFIKIMHTYGTKDFSSLLLFDRIFGDLVGTIVFTCSENEVKSYARFMFELLTDLSELQKSEELYIKEGRGNYLPGFQKRWHSNAAPGEADILTWSEYQSVVLKWHRKMFHAFKGCFKANEYMHTRNAIIVLTKIAPFFPSERSHGEELEAAVASIIASEHREDLKVLAIGYKAVLAKNKSAWCSVAEFLDPSLGRALPEPKVEEKSTRVTNESSTPRPLVPARPEMRSTGSRIASPTPNKPAAATSSLKQELPVQETVTSVSRTELPQKPLSQHPPIKEGSGDQPQTKVEDPKSETSLLPQSIAPADTDSSTATVSVKPALPSQVMDWENIVESTKGPQFQWGGAMNGAPQTLIPAQTDAQPATAQMQSVKPKAERSEAPNSAVQSEVRDRIKIRKRSRSQERPVPEREVRPMPEGGRRELRERERDRRRREEGAERDSIDRARPRGPSAPSTPPRERDRASIAVRRRTPPPPLQQPAPRGDVFEHGFERFSPPPQREERRMPARGNGMPERPAQQTGLTISGRAADLARDRRPPNGPAMPSTIETGDGSYSRMTLPGKRTFSDRIVQGPGSVSSRDHVDAKRSRYSYDEPPSSRERLGPPSGPANARGGSSSGPGRAVSDRAAPGRGERRTPPLNHDRTPDRPHPSSRQTRWS